MPYAIPSVFRTAGSTKLKPFADLSSQILRASYWVAVAQSFGQRVEVLLSSCPDDLGKWGCPFPGQTNDGLVAYANDMPGT
jgi:hypothetical protein